MCLKYIKIHNKLTGSGSGYTFYRPPNFRDDKDRNSWDTQFRVNKGNILHKIYINL